MVAGSVRFAQIFHTFFRPVPLSLSRIAFGFSARLEPENFAPGKTKPMPQLITHLLTGLLAV